MGYAIFIWLLVKLKERLCPITQKDLPAIEYPEVTILIAAYNEEDYVDIKMHNTESLEYPTDKLHIVWVTDGSTDRTVTRLKQYPKVQILHETERKGKTAAINRSMTYIKTPIIIFTDANAILNQECIKEIVSLFIDEKVGCVAAEKRIRVQSEDTASSSGEGFYWRYESFIKDLDSRLYSVVGAAGELYAIRRDLYESISDNTLLDDFVLSMKIAMKGYKIAYCPTAYAMEYSSESMKEEEKRKVRIAAGGLQSVWRLRSLLNIFRYRILSFQYISHRVLRWAITPFALFALLPLNIVLSTNQNIPYHTLYSILLVFQCIFYLLALAGYICSQKEIKYKILFIPYYFLFMNLNVFRAYPYLLRKKRIGVWEKSKRKSSGY